MKNSLFTDSQLRGFFSICEWMESMGNGGFYRSEFSNMHGRDFILGRKHLAYRQGIVFYSTGWGWRLRKNWRETFGQRFFEFVVGWKDANFVTTPKARTSLK